MTGRHGSRCSEGLGSSPCSPPSAKGSTAGLPARRSGAWITRRFTSDTDKNSWYRLDFHVCDNISRRILKINSSICFAANNTSFLYFFRFLASRYASYRFSKLTISLNKLLCVFTNFTKTKKFHTAFCHQHTSRMVLFMFFSQPEEWTKPPNYNALGKVSVQPYLLAKLVICKAETVVAVRVRRIAVQIPREQTVIRVRVVATDI